MSSDLFWLEVTSSHMSHCNSFDPEEPAKLQKVKQESCAGHRSRGTNVFPKGPCTQIVYTLALKYLYRDYTKVNILYEYKGLVTTAICAGSL